MHYNSDEFVQKVCEQIRFKAAHKGIKQELEAHIDENTEQYIAEGLDKETAAIKAVQSMGDPIEIGGELNKIHKPQTEWGVIASIILLTILGIGTMFFIGELPFGNSSIFGLRQIVYSLFGLVVLMGMYLFDYTKLYKYNKVIFASGIVLTIITVLFGIEKNGSLFLRIGGITCRTVYICNLMFMVAIIAELIKYKDSGRVGFLKIGLFCAAALAALIFNPYFNLVFIMLIVYVIILTVAVIKKHFDDKQRWGYLSIMYGVIFISFLVFKSKIVSINDNSQFIGYSANMIRKYLEQSQWIGKSEFLNEYGWRPLPENYWVDYFLTIIIANFGWLAGSLVISLFVILFGTMIFRALNIKNNFGFYITIGTTIYLMINFIINILISMGYVEFFDCKLPFVSFGGTDYIGNAFIVGLFLSVWRRNLIVASDMNSHLNHY
ncbi:cell division protein FtsW [Clostridium polyendosporum]|uniref:Cell division protein FtsW n=1 Tax=Clostridium polyendosporum TaxID=69208 RepID=A0A919VFM8_9CLOT|nr:FtsW/RodA/SpoVE family cell cycle protein [Clostridium polyendosporum]GIM30479.1 cell division protein FtsW [Clostridium polyendosporum]